MRLRAAARVQALGRNVGVTLLRKVGTLPATFRFILGHPLNARRPLRALWTWAKWQAAARVSGDPVIVDFVDSARLLVEPGMTGATLNVYCGLQDFEEMTFLCHYLKATDVFGDVGANVGVYSVLASAVCRARSHAFEPVTSTFQALVRNIELNDMRPLCIPREICVGAERGHAYVTSDLGPENHVLPGRGGEDRASQVAVDRLDALLSHEGHIVLKIDVEGFEHAVLEGAQELLGQGFVEAVIIEANAKTATYQRPGTTALLMLQQAGFAPLRYDPWSRTCEVVDLSYRTFSGNLILARSPAAAQDRCRRGRKIRIPRLSAYV